MSSAREALADFRAPTPSVAGRQIAASSIDLTCAGVTSPRTPGETATATYAARNLSSTFSVSFRPVVRIDGAEVGLGDAVSLAGGQSAGGLTVDFEVPSPAGREVTPQLDVTQAFFVGDAPAEGRMADRANRSRPARMAGCGCSHSSSRSLLEALNPTHTRPLEAFNGHGGA